MQHPRHADVVHVLEPSSHHVRKVDAGHRPSQHRPFARMPSRGAGIERHLEHAIADQFGVLTRRDGSDVTAIAPSRAVNCSTGTPMRAEARPVNVWRAVAAASARPARLKLAG